MKTRESGMPEEELWESFFRPRQALLELGLTVDTRHAVEFGSGYGTFSLAAARIIQGKLTGLDIDAGLIEHCRTKAVAEDLSNAEFVQGDFVEDSSGLPDNSTDYLMLFNILHAEQPEILLREARRILMPSGKLAVMHWNYDPQTPRGPSMSIRPRPQDCRRWVSEAGFNCLGPLIDLPPWHYGFIAQ